MMRRKIFELDPKRIVVHQNDYSKERRNAQEGLTLEDVLLQIKAWRARRGMSSNLPSPWRHPFMKLVDSQSLPTNPGNPSYFTGAVTLRPFPVEGANPVKLFRVEFAPGARTNWHTHSGVQILFVAEGRCRFQHEGGPVQEAGVGETIYIPTGEKHWHGATPDAPMAHVAVNIELETDWLEPVSEEQTRG